MSNITIIVPVIGLEGLFETTLASVLRHRPENADVIVVHDGTYTNPHQLQDEARFVSTERRSNLIRLFNAGIEAADSDLVSFFRPGIQLTRSWYDHLERAFLERKLASVSPAFVCGKKPTRLIAAGIKPNFHFHRQVVGAGQRLGNQVKSLSQAILGPTSWAGVYRLDPLNKLGPIDTRLDPHFLDLEIALGLKHLGNKAMFAAEFVVSHDFPKMILREFELPTGVSSQRAIRRHAGGSDFGRSLISFLYEICTSPFATWKFQHALSRLSARAFTETDDEFANRLNSIKRLNSIQEFMDSPKLHGRAA